MSFYSKFKSALGFSDNDYEDEVNLDPGRDATVTPLRDRRKDEAAYPSDTSSPQSQVVDDNPQSVDDETVLPDEIFQSVVDLFNESLPPFLKSAVDRQAQRQYIYDSLSDSMKTYINRLTEQSDRRVQQIWESDRKRLNEELQAVREKAKKIEEASAEWKEQKLSAERQKRALSERVHDLEKQIDSFQAEKEQYELENKSLVNKLRAMSVQAGEPIADDGSSDIIQSRIKALDEENASFKAQIAQLLEQIDTYNKRCEMADAMINDLNHKLNATRSQLAECEGQLKNANQLLADANDDSELVKAKALNIELNDKLRLASEQLDARLAEITSKEQSLKSASTQIESLEAIVKSREEQIEALNEEAAMLRQNVEESHNSLLEFEESLGKFEEIKHRKDTQIAELQEQLDRKQDEVNSHIAEIESLRSTIENNLKLQIESEQQLREEIERMKSSGEYDRPRRHKSSKPIILDSSLDDTDWLVSTPPPGSNARISSIPDDEFGYQEPKRKSSGDDPAQMSLW